MRKGCSRWMPGSFPGSEVSCGGGRGFHLCPSPHPLPTRYREKFTMTMALLLIDIQNDYFPGGRMEVEGSLEASLKAQEILTHCREKNVPVVHIQHVAIRPGATFFLPDSDGVKIHANVAPHPGEVIFQKNYPNSFRDTPLLRHLQWPRHQSRRRGRHDDPHVRGRHRAGSL